MRKRFQSSWPTCRASATHSSMETPSRGTNGITSVAPIRGCTPVWCVMSMSSAALPAPRITASATASGLPARVITERLWSVSLVRSRIHAPAMALMASTSASTFDRLRPSEKFGTHSIRRFMKPWGFALDRFLRKSQKPCARSALSELGYISILRDFLMGPKWKIANSANLPTGYHGVTGGSFIARTDNRAVLFWFAMAYATLTEKLLSVVDRMPNDRALSLRINGRWEPTSSAEFLRRIAGLSDALEQLGVKTGDRGGLVATNRPEWHVADFAILGRGAADVPIYFNESPDRIVYMLNHSGAEVVIVAGETQSRRLLECRSRLTSVKHTICAAAPPDLGDDVLRYETL